jgi:serine/threonine-protein kinase RsbW
MRTETQGFISRVEQLAQANAFVTSCLDRFHIDPTIAFKVLLALEEAFVNICHHAYQNSEGGIEITCSCDDDPDPAFVLEIADKGAPFDVLSLPDPDTTLSVEERPVGGLGIYLIRTLSSSAIYTRANNQNRLQMRFMKKP